MIRIRSAVPAETWRAGLLLLLLIATVRYDVIFLGRSLIHTNHSNPFDYRPLPENYGPDLIQHAEWTARNLWPFANIRDPGANWWQWEPGTAFLKQAMARREWPFWDPYVAAGAPAMANMTQAFFFPPYAAVVALGASAGLRNAYFLLLIWSAGLFTFLFLRRHDLTFTSSFAGAAVVVMGGALNQNIGSFMGQTASCLPAAVYVTRCFLDRPDGRRAAILAATYASISLASFPPILLGIFGVAAVYALVAIAIEPAMQGRRAGTLLRWTIATALGVGLVAFYYVPALVLHAAMPHVGALYENVGFEAMEIRSAYQLLSPTLVGGVQVYLWNPFVAESAAHIPYVGIAALTLALLSGPQGSPRQRTLFVVSAALAAIVLCKMFGLPPVQWIAHLPFFNKIHFAHYLGITLGFLLAFLTALGVERILREGAPTVRTILIAIAALAAVEHLWQLAGPANVFRSRMWPFWAGDWRFLAGATGATVVVLAAAAMKGLPPWARAAAVAALIGTIAVEGIYNNTYPHPRRWETFEHPVPYMQALQKRPALDRILPFGAPPANAQGAFGIHSVNSLMTFNPPRMYELYMKYTNPPKWVFMSQPSEIPPEPVLDRANVGIVGVYTSLTRIVQDAGARGYTKVFDDGFMTLLERPRTGPRFAFSADFVVVPTAAALDALATVPSHQIVLEEDPGVPVNRVAVLPEVAVERYNRNSVTLTVDAPVPGILYASESFFDGWTARVDDAPARIMPANYAFRAIPIQAGRHRVEMRYWPPGLTPGLAISVLSAAALAALATLRQGPWPATMHSS